MGEGEGGRGQDRGSGEYRGNNSGFNHSVFNHSVFLRGRGMASKAGAANDELQLGSNNNHPNIRRHRELQLGRCPAPLAGQAIA